MKTKDFTNYDYDLKFIEKHMDAKTAPKENLITSHVWNYQDLQSLALILFRKDQLKLNSQIVNLRVNSSHTKTETVQVKWAYAYSEDILNLETKVTQTGPDTYDISVTVQNPDSSSLFSNSTSKSEYQNVKFVPNQNKNLVCIDNGETIFTREHFWSENDLYLFNEDGSCFEIVKTSDLVEKGEDDSASNSAYVKTTMPGVVVKVNVNAGDSVKKGDVILILEAMKMENMMKATRDGVVEEVFVKMNQFIEAGTNLMKFKE